MRKSACSLFLGFLLLLSSAAFGESERFHWTGRLDPGQTIEIRGVNGDIRAEEGSSEVQVDAIKTGHRRDPSEVRIEVVEHSGGVTICAVYPGADGPNVCRPGGGDRNSVRNNDVRVDFMVRVPGGVNFLGHTVNGDVEALDLASNASARTVNGKIELRCDGFGEARTVNGSIHASFGAVFEDDVEFSTVNGSVTLELPGDVNARLDARSVNGGIRSDFPISVSGRWGSRRAQGTLGSGGPELSISTVNGSIKIVEGKR